MAKNPFVWTKSSFTDGVQCIEARLNPDTGAVELRDDENSGTVVLTTAGSLSAFLHGAKAGEFDHLAQ